LNASVAGWQSTKASFINRRIRVDPVNNVILVAGQAGISVFDRTATGNVKPRAIIRGAGPTGGSAQFEIYNGLIIAPRGDYTYAWSLRDTEATVRPVLKIPTPLGPRAAQLGIAIDPAHKEVLVATGEGNTMRTFSAPELFDWH
jgi:DNA-binding beta-propeller fold protein YncE